MTARSVLFALKQCARSIHGLPFAIGLARRQRWSVDRVTRFNLNCRRDVVRMAYTHIPFYRRKYANAGLTVGDFDDPEIFRRIPILERREVAEHADEMVHPGYQRARLQVSTTGGSSGVPLKTYNDPRIPLHVMSWRMLGWWGVDIGAPSGYLYRNVPHGRNRTLQRSLLWPTRRDWLSAAAMTQSNMELFYQSLTRDRTEYLVGYVGAIDVFGTFLHDKSLTLPHLKAVWTTSSPLPQGKRTWLENVFGCPVYTQYGSCEFYWIAAECAEQNGMHVGNDVRHVEIVKGDTVVEDGEFGDIIVTDLINMAFPLIRYRIGDEGRLLPRECSCGLPFPLMDYVRGRVTDNIVTKSGARIPGEYWTTICDDFSGSVKAFQVHQFGDRMVEVRYQMHKGADPRPVVAVMAARMSSQYGNDLDVRFVESDVNVNENGKTRFIVSEVP